MVGGPLRFLLQLAGIAVLAGCVTSPSSLAKSNAPLTSFWPEKLINSDGVVLGEIHGTNEFPAAFLELVKTGPKPMLVGLELSAAEVDLPCMKKGSWPESWLAEMQDGRRSKAMFAMVCELQELERDGKVRIIYFDNRDAENPNFYAHASRLLGKDMASGIFAKFAVLSGNFHSSNADGRLAALLRADGLQVVTATGASSRGSAWVCTRQGCGPTDYPSPFCKVANATALDSPLWMFGGEPGTERIGRNWDACLSVPSTSPSSPAAVQ